MNASRNRPAGSLRSVTSTPGRVIRSVSRTSAMTQGTEDLLAILRVGHETSMRGTGLSLSEALRQVRYADRRANFGPTDLRPLIIAHPEVSESWFAYSEDKRTSGGWYLLRSGEIGQVSDPKSATRFESLEEARQIIGAFIRRYNAEWILERFAYRTPAAVRRSFLKRAA